MKSFLLTTTSLPLLTYAQRSQFTQHLVNTYDFRTSTRESDRCGDRGFLRCCRGEANLCTSTDKSCYCDEACMQYNDCCKDYKRTCQFEFITFPGSVNESHFQDAVIPIAHTGPQQFGFSLVDRAAMPLPFDMAQRACELQGGFLADVNTQELNKFIVDQLQKIKKEKGVKRYDFWIGLNDVETEGIFKWSSDLHLANTKSNFENWANRQPSTKSASRAQKEDCVVLSSRKKFQWNDFKCRAKKNYICQRPLENLEPGTARILGGSSFHTFDGNVGNIIGEGQTTLVTTCAKDIDGPQFFVTADTELEFESQRTILTGVNLILLHDSGENVGTLRKVISLQTEGTVTVSDESSMASIDIPYPRPGFEPADDSDRIRIKKSGQNIHLKTKWGLEIQISSFFAEVKLPPAYFSKVCGIFGNFDGNANNDKVKLESNSRFQNDRELSFYWKSRDDFVQPSSEFTTEADMKGCPVAKREQVMKHCGLLLSGRITNPFHKCLLRIPGDQYFQQCAKDVCAHSELYSGKRGTEISTDDNLFCPHYEGLARHCSALGFSVEWRDMKFCPMKCPLNSEYHSCASPCTRTCADPYGTQCAEANNQCIEACVCDDGYVWQGNQCVLASECGCLGSEGQYHPVGESFFIDYCSKQCTCPAAGSDTICVPATCESNQRCKRKGYTFTCDFIDDSDLACLEKEEKDKLNSLKTGGQVVNFDKKPQTANPDYVKPDACCNGVPYNSFEQGCCDGVVFWYENGVCCSGQVKEGAFVACDQ